MTTAHCSGCPINLSLQVFGDKWSLLILRDMIFGTRPVANAFIVYPCSIIRSRSGDNDYCGHTCSRKGHVRSQRSRSGLLYQRPLRAGTERSSDFPELLAEVLPGRGLLPFPYAAHLLAGCQQRVQAAFTCYSAVLEDYDVVRPSQGRPAMGDCEDGGLPSCEHPLP